MNQPVFVRHKKAVIPAALILTAVWLVVSVFAGRGIFVFPERSDSAFLLAASDYVICRILSTLVMFAVSHAISRIIFSRDEVRTGLLPVIKYGLIYLPVLAGVLFIKLPAGFLSNDEYAIVNDAVNLIHDTWFTYLTVYYYIISFMLIPVKYGPIFVKVIIEFFVAGYTVCRSTSYFGKKPGLIMYALFLMYPVIAYTTSAHRLPVYFLIYLALFVKLLFDRLESRKISPGGVFFMLLAGAVLTQWRTEGIYLLALVPILLFIVYPNLRSKKSVAAVIASYVILQFIIAVPQNFITAESVSGQANDRMKPFYAYTITNMLRNGLDRDRNANDLSVVDRYISLESIDAISEHFGDINYEDVLILTKEEFSGVRPEAGYTEYFEFSEAVKRIFVNNPDVFLRTRWGAFCYAAVPFPFALAPSGLKSLAYNLFIPTAFVLLALLYCLIKKRWFDFFVFGGLVCHWLIVFILAPASYFKYYFPVYIMAYFYMFMILTWFVSRKTGSVQTGSSAAQASDMRSGEGAS